MECHFYIIPITMRNRQWEFYATKIVRNLQLLSVLVTLIVSCGCQAAPGTAEVASKNDGIFEAALSNIQEADYGAQEEQVYSYTDSFTNSEGSITCTIQLENVSIKTVMPVIQVTPHSISSEDAETIARIFFWDANIYEYSETMSKRELEAKILSVKQLLADPERLQENFGTDEELIRAVTEQYENMLAEYECQHEAAPDIVDALLCQWEFHPQSYYYDQTTLDTTAEEYASYNKTQYITAETVVNGIPYIYEVCNRD